MRTANVAPVGEHRSPRQLQATARTRMAPARRVPERTRDISATALDSDAARETA